MKARAFLEIAPVTLHRHPRDLPHFAPSDDGRRPPQTIEGCGGARTESITQSGQRVEGTGYVGRNPSTTTPVGSTRAHKEPGRKEAQREGTCYYQGSRAQEHKTRLGTAQHRLAGPYARTLAALIAANTCRHILFPTQHTWRHRPDLRNRNGVHLQIKSRRLRVGVTSIPALHVRVRAAQTHTAPSPVNQFQMNVRGHLIQTGSLCEPEFRHPGRVRRRQILYV